MRKVIHYAIKTNHVSLSREKTNCSIKFIFYGHPTKNCTLRASWASVIIRSLAENENETEFFDVTRSREERKMQFAFNGDYGWIRMQRIPDRPFEESREDTRETKSRWSIRARRAESAVHSCFKCMGNTRWLDTFQGTALLVATRRKSYRINKVENPDDECNRETVR